MDTPDVTYANETFRPGMIVILSDDSGTALCDSLIACSSAKPAATVCRVIKGQSLITKTGPFASKYFIAVKVTNIKVKRNTKYPYRPLGIRGASPQTLAGLKQRNLYAWEAANISFPDAGPPRFQGNEGRADEETKWRAIPSASDSNYEVLVGDLPPPLQVQTTEASLDYRHSWQRHLSVLSDQPIAPSIAEGAASSAANNFTVCGIMPSENA